MKKLNVIRCIFLILMLLVPFFGLVRAQTCDPLLLKTLSETRVTYFDKVTKGEKATITIKYPLIGTTYTVTDNDGNSKSFTYTSGTEEFVDLEIDSPVNAVRRYSLKAEKDGCSFQTGFNYTITPETDVKLAIRVEQEWCGTSGAIRFKVVGTGVNNANYNFYLRKHNEAYDFSTAKPHTGAISLAAGKYYVIAKRKSGSWPEPAESSEIEIKNDVKTIAFTVSQIPKICGATSLGIRVDINQDQWGNHAANYPVYYTLYQSDGVTPVRPDTVHQTSNIFTGLTAGNYVVKVENFCGANPIPQPISITDESFAFTHLYTPIAGKEFNCTKAQFDALYLYGTGIKKAVDSDAFNYPFTVKFTFTDPDGVVYTPTYVINNKTDLDTYLPKYYYGEALVATSNFQEFNLPNKSGTWKVKADITMCGNTTSLAEVTSVLYNPIENAMVEVANDGTSPTACHTTQLRLRYKHRRDNSATLNTYLVIEQGPTRPSTDLFNYAGAGFSLMPATHSNPLLRGKYAKRVLFSSWDFQTVVIPDYLRNGDTFNFRLVDDECDPTRYADLDPVTVTVPPTAVGVDIQVIASCEGATDIGAPNGSIRVERKNGAAVKKIEIIEYTDTANVVHTSGTIGGTSLSLPYTLTDNNRADENNWYVRDLPQGKYKFRITDVCNNITIPNHVPQITGQTYNLSFAPGCEPVVVGYIDLEGTEDWRYNQSEFVIQHYKEDDQVWEEWAYAGLPYDTPINRKTTDEGLGKVGKFRIVRRIKNLNGGYECQMVIKEETFGGDLSGIQVVGFGCNDKKYHVMLTPEGGTAPFTYKLVHKLPAGSTTPDTSVARTQTGDQFFINLDGNNTNNAYKFAITDACGKTVEKELTIANIQKPKIEPKPKRDYYCTGQEVKLTITDLGPNVQVEWYREDNPSTPLATGFSYTIPSLTATDFAKKYYVKIKIPSQHAIENCVTDEVDAFQFQESSVTVPPLARTNNGETLKCITGPTVFDVESLFNIPNSHLAANLPTGVTVRIREVSGVIAVPNNHKINLRPRNGGQKPLGMGSYTFYYEVLSPCGEVITYQEAKLTVKELVDFQPKTTIKVCNANVTLDEVKQEIIKGSPKVTALQPDFTWYATESNANARTSPLAGSTSLSTPNGSSQDYWLRLTKNGYCTPEEPIKVTIKGETGVTAKNLGDVGCQLTTIASLKALIDPSDAANVLIYRRGTTVPLADDALVDNNEQYDYAKNIYQCVTAPQQVNFTFTPRTTAKNEQVDVCFYIGYYGMRTTLTQIKAKLQERYPTGATFKFYSAPEAIPANEYTSLNREFIQSELFYFTVQEAGKCVSLPFSVRPGQNAMTEVETKTVTICEEITVGELINKMQTDFGYSNVKIHQGRGTNNMSNDTFVDWNNSIYFSAEETGKCRSTKVPLIIKRNTNVTVATPKTFEVCKAVGQQPKVSDLKAVVGNDARIFVRDNNNRWVLQADTQNVYEANSYFYTIEEAGKCPSEKTALVVRITRKTTTPTAPADPMWCSGKKVSDLKSYIASKGVTGTIKIYESATATTELADATLLEKNKPYHFTTTQSLECESNRVALTVTIYASPTITSHPATPSTPPCGGSTPTALSVVATGDDISYQWYKNTTNDNTSGTAIPGKTSATFDPPTDTVETTYYYVKVSSGKGCAAAVSNTAKIEVTKPTKITRQPGNISYCMGAYPRPDRLEVAAEGTGTLTYQWYQISNGVTSAISGATDSYYNYSIDNAHVTKYYVKVTSDCGTVTSNEVVVNIIPSPSIKPGGDLTANDNATYCKGATSVRKLKVDVQQGAGVPVYQWYKATTPMGTGEEIDRAWNDEYTPDVSEAGTFYYYVTAKNQRDCTNGVATSARAKIVVNETTAIVDDLSEDEVKYCKGATANALTVKMKGTPNYTYTWYKASNTTETGTVVRTQTSATAVQDAYTPSAADEGTFYYYVKVHSSCGDDKTSKRTKITIQSLPAITTQPATLSKPCKDSTLTLSIAHTGDGTRSVQWYRNTTNSNTGGTAISGETASTFTVPTGTVGTTYYYAVVSSDTGCTPAVSNVAEVVVTQPTAIDTNLSTTEKKYCKDQTSGVLDLLIKAKGTAPFIYKWYKAANATDAGTLVRTEANTNSDEDSYTPVVTTVETAYYYVEVSSACGSDVTSARAHITVTENTAIDTDLSTAEVKYCKGATANALLVKAKGTPPFEYKWHKVDAATSIDTVVRTEANSLVAQDTYTPETTTVGSSYYYVEIHSDCGTDVTSARAKITVTKPTAITTNLSTTEVKYCKDEPSPAALTVEAEGTGNLSYTWYKVKEGTSTVTPIAGQTTATLAASAIEVATRGTTYYYVVVHSDCGSDVTSARAKVTITDPDTPTVSDQTFCNAATVADLRPNDSDIKWYASPTGGAPLTDGTRALAHGNKYYAARTLGSCESPRAEVTVTIISLAKPIVTEDTAAACGQPSVWAITTGFDTNATYSFVKEDGTPVSTGQLTGASHKITGLDPGRYKVIATKGSCTQTSDDVFEVKAALRVPDIPDLEIVPASCGVITKAKVKNHIAGQTYWHNGTRIDYDTASHELTLDPGNYTITAKNDNCESAASTPFVIEAAKPIPGAPVVSRILETCEKPTVAKVDNYVSGQSYWYNGTRLTVDDTTHEIISGLAVGDGYTITTKNTAGCESKASNSFDIKKKKPTTRIVDDPADATYQLNQTERVNDLSVTINGTARSYKWFKNTTSNYTNGEEVATTETYRPPTNEVGIFYYWLEITAECGGDKTRSGIAKIEVIDQHRKAIRAIDDNFGKISNTANTTTTQSIFSSGVDTMEGVLGVLTTNEVDIHYGELKHNGTVLTQPDANITLNGDGTLSVKQNTPEGQYEYTYKICEKGTTNCSNEATVKFEVTATRIIANDDGIWEVGRTGGLLPNVLDNDVLGGQIGLTVSDVIIERNAAEAAPDPKITIEADGRVSVKQGLAPGDYIYYYTIKERANVANVANAKVKIKVVNFAAVGDEFELINTPTVEQKTGSVLANDELNGTKNLSENPNVVLTPGDRSLNTLIMNPDDGTITIPPGTPNGTYRYNYRICTRTPAECREAQAVIKLYTVIAKEDDYSSTPVNTTLEAKTIGNVLENDDYPEKPNYSKVDLSVVGNSHDIELKPNGDVVVPQGMPAGNYVIRYRLCIAGQTDDNSCQEANIKIVVFQDKPLTIYNGISADGDGHNDYFRIESIERYPVNNLKIFNRWGVLVYEKDGYRNDTEPFDGHSNGRATISAGSKLPQGTYYYILEYQDSVGQTQTNQGWLYLKY